MRQLVRAVNENGIEAGFPAQCQNLPVVADLGAVDDGHEPFVGKRLQRQFGLLCQGMIGGQGDRQFFLP